MSISGDVPDTEPEEARSRRAFVAGVIVSDPVHTPFTKAPDCAGTRVTAGVPELKTVCGRKLLPTPWVKWVGEVLPVEISK